jgi:2-dehydro-3-deoxyphosphogluconate aldolase/(4S)-4-hydroxy-2-oxoglutarate aldolase
MIEQIEKIGIIPQVKIDDAKNALPLAEALIGGGIPFVEICFSTEEAKDAIDKISTASLEILVGAGSIRTTSQVDQAIAAGAKFITTTGFNRNIVEHCVKNGVLIIPGCATPADIEQALELGIDTVKLFPAESLGGQQYIKDISEEYPTIKFIPTGRIDNSNIVKYLALDAVIACGGSWMAMPELIKAGKFDEITASCKVAVDTVLGFGLGHVGINNENEEAAYKAAEMFEITFGSNFKVRDQGNAVFAGNHVDAVKTMYYGTNGHVAISTNSVPRAVAYLEKQGWKFIPKTAKFLENGKMRSIYMEGEIAGLGLHLIQNQL